MGVEDTSDNGCYCSDDELRGMLRLLFQDVKARTCTVPNMAVTSSLAPSPNRVPGPPGLPPPTREGLIWAAFHACDVDNDGWLKSQELRKFAIHAGFNGGDEDWDRE